MPADVIAVLENADASCPVDSATHHLGTWGRLLLDRDVAVDDLERHWLGELEAPDGRLVAQGLMLSLVVVVDDPDIESGLALFGRLEALLREELLSHRLVQPLDLARRGRRIGGGEEMTDPVVEADAIEQHVGGLVGEPAGEDLAVIGQDLFRDAVGW